MFHVHTWIRNSWFALALVFSTHATAQTFLGDLDADSRTTIQDLVRLNAHLSGDAPLDTNLTFLADLNQDGAIDADDINVMVEIILGRQEPQALPLTTIVGLSPNNGESDVAITRETVIQFSAPLSSDTDIDSVALSATFAGQPIAARKHLATDRRSLTLFYPSALPASARVRVLLNADNLRDERGLVIDPDGDGVPGGSITMDFDTLTLTSLPNTSVCGRIFASDLVFSQNGSEFVNRPLPGVTITVDGTQLSVVTDDNGDFRLEDCPAGEFFVHIDGRTVPNVQPPGAFYPNVGKQWTSIPGEETNIGEIYLPIIPPETLQATSDTEDTLLEFDAEFLAQNPKFEGVRVTVPANSLFSDDGTRGGLAGIAPVQPDRLPGEVSSDLPIQDVITIQTDGASNFDVPAPICLPNLEDPLTGERLGPGESAALWSFNHDIGRFEIVGSMTVSEDGTLICTDEGVGVEAPGWHGSSTGTQGSDGTIRTVRRSRSKQEKPGKNDPKADPKNQVKIPCPNDKNKFIVLYKDRKRPKANAEAKAGDPVYPHSGEFYEDVIDLRILGRGMDFIWSRMYRSQIGTQSAQGNNWDCSYNIFIEQLGDDILLCDGNSRQDVYVEQPDGSYISQGFFRVLQENADGSFTLTFEHLGTWTFFPFDGRPEAGKVATTADSNGNTMAFEYDVQGRLVRIIDTLDRPIDIAYNAEGFIESVTDFLGRSVVYEYYGRNEPNGNFGDLKSVRSPTVTNTPTGNDFPQGKLTTYTYSNGFENPLLNGNLLTITDGRRNDPNDPTFGDGPYLINQYAATTDPEDPNFDRLTRQTWGNPGEVLDYTYLPLFPSNANGRAVIRTIVNDRRGLVKEYFYDESNRLVIFREYTGFADADRPTTDRVNRPTGKLRPDDPEFFQTRFEWNDDDLPKRTIYPNGNIQENIYESDLDPRAPQRTRSNLVATRLLPGSHTPVGDQPVIVETYEYDTQFGGCCGFNFVTRHTDGRGNVTTHQYDSRGNRTRSVNRIASMVEDFEYNEFGQLVAHLQPENDGVRRRDEMTYYTEGPQRGYLRSKILDAGGFALETILVPDAVGNVIELIDPKGNRKNYVFNELDQMVREISRETVDGSGIRYIQDYHFDANDNPIRVDAPNLDHLGQSNGNPVFTTTYEYEILNHVIRRTQEVSAAQNVVTEYGYDANRNRILEKLGEATNGTQPTNTRNWVFDERDIVFRLTRALGDPDQSTSQFDYDGNENIKAERHGLEDANPHITTRTFDSYGRPVVVVDPMGNETRYSYDANHNLTHQIRFGELVDVPGSANNVRMFEEEAFYDALNRQIRRETAFFDIDTGADLLDGLTTIRFVYNNAGLLVEEVDDLGNRVERTYDTMYRPLTFKDGMGNSATYTYDANSNIVQIVETDLSDLGAPQETFTQTFVVDNHNRLLRHSDNAGNVMEFAYDSRNNRTRVIDATRAGPNEPGNVTELAFDGLRRLVRESRILTDTGRGGGTSIGSIDVLQQWDDSSRLLQRTDDNGSATRYTYDPLGRMTAVTYGDGAIETKTFDAHNNPTSWTDANGTRIDATYDRLNRQTRRDITPGPGVDNDTTFETFVYDGYSRLREATDDDATVSRRYNSLNKITSETLNGVVTAATHDAMGNQTGLTYPSGFQTTKLFDADNRLTRINGPIGIIADLHHRGIVRSEGCDFGNGTQDRRAFDADRRPTRITHSALNGAAFEDRIYSWDAMDNKTLDGDALASVNRAFAYDSIYRLTQGVDANDTPLSYTYDGVGNRLSVSQGGVPANYVLAPQVDLPVNQYSQTPEGALAHDEKGNLVQNVTTGALFSFDYRNQLVEFQRDATNGATYSYDPLGRRIERTVTTNGTGETTRYYYSKAQVVEERDGANTMQRQFVYGIYPDMPLMMRTPTTEFYFHGDDTYNIRAITDNLGGVVERYQYGDFGAPAATDANGGPIAQSTVDNPYMFQGRRYDPETGFYYYRSRYLDPASGRFISRDTLGVWGDGSSFGNGYTFVANNPRSRVDPMGTAGFNPMPKEGFNALKGIPRRSPYDKATPTGTQGHFADRPLSSTSGVEWALNKGGEWLTRGVSVLGYITPDALEPNLVAAHEHYFEGSYDESNPKEGHYGFGVGWNASEDKGKYNWHQSAQFSDDVMGMARDMIWNDYYKQTTKKSASGREIATDVDTYGMFSNNCQHFCDDLRSWYDRFIKTLCDENGSGLGKKTDQYLRDMWVSRFGDVDVVIETD